MIIVTQNLIMGNYSDKLHGTISTEVFELLIHLLPNLIDYFISACNCINDSIMQTLSAFHVYLVSSIPRSHPQGGLVTSKSLVH